MNTTLTRTFVLWLLATPPVFAVPVLQIGAPAGSGDTGQYADYFASLTDPTEEDTARTTGNTIYVAGVYQNKNVLNLGGQYGSGENWSEVNSDYGPFDGRGAILLVAVPDGDTGTLTITVDGNASTLVHTSSTLSGQFPNNHDPLKDDVADFLFFDIGDFKNSNAVPDFATETGAADGEIKTIVFSNTGFDWLHFDVLALETSEKGTNLVTTIENNPGSHDVTAFPGGSLPPLPPQPAPEPGILWLLGGGLLGLRFWAKKA